MTGTYQIPVIAAVMVAVQDDDIFRRTEFRARFNLTQDELARKVGVRRETIVFLEKGKYNPSLKLAYDIAVVFNVKI